jgi:sortase A
LLVEVMAVVALIYVVVRSFSGLDALNQEVAEARRIQPVSAAPVDDLLPGSSSPPATSGEVPAALRSMVRSGTPIPIPTPGPQMATRLTIPSIGVDSVIVEGDAWEDLKKGVGHHVGSANPGERGNAVYSGHNDVYGEVFRRLEEVKVGDRITVYAAAHLFRYEVKRLRIVGPKEVSVMAPSPDATLTLITCYPYRVDTQRVVVIAVLVE